MTAPTTTLAAQHATHKPRIDELRHLADRAAAVPPGELADGLDGILGFLTGTLLPHLAAEEAELYPTLTGPGVVDLLRFDHDDIRRRVAQLQGHLDELASQLLPVARHELVGDLYGLHAVLRLHHAKEEALLEVLRDAVPVEPDPAPLPDGLGADGG